jgi:LmbE family N-acetylglucosaminyl deacetylase
MMTHYTEPLRLLVVVAHPHDITHMAGTCAHHVRRGDSVSVVAVTGGTTMHNEPLLDELRKPPEQRDPAILAQTAESYTADKAHEMTKACALFGISDVRTLPFEDLPLKITDELVEVLAEVIYDVRPHVLLTHAPYSRWPGAAATWLNDHTNAGIAVYRAQERCAKADMQGKRAPHTIATTYFMGVEFAYYDIHVSVDISDQMDNRIEAEKMFETQGHTEEFAQKRLEIGAGQFGWHAKVAYAEPFVRAQQQVQTHLTVTEHDVRSSLEPTSEKRARVLEGFMDR